jgi:hypothetical protein
MEGKQMMEEKQILEDWYRYAARTTGFIGGALRIHREKMFLSQEQQRTMLDIRGEQYNDLWLRLQAMLLPRTDQFTEDLQRIVTKVTSEEDEKVTIDVERLAELIHAGLE